MEGSSKTCDYTLEVKLPQKFVVLQQLGEGGYGKVVQCLDLEAKKIVAVKTTTCKEDLSNEASIMKLLMENNLDKNIVRYYEELSTDDYLVYEVLDKTLFEYLQQRKAPMRLQDIRVVIQQLATAFDALKNIGVIHSDIKTNNIMLVDDVGLRVKIIDFGLAILKADNKSTRLVQVPSYRAPEIIMGLPYSETLDIWSLGCVMAVMVFGFSLFPGRTNHELLHYMIDILGMPPDHLIVAGKKSRTYFTMTDSKETQWRLKKPMECWEASYNTPDKRLYTFRSLDEAKEMRLEEDNIAEADERRECIELLKAMLRWDEKERITPSEILAHPFITGQYPGSISHLRSCVEVGTSKDQAAELTPEKTPKKIPENTPKKTPEKTPKKIPENTPKKTPEKTPKKTQDKVPETIINQVAQPSTKEILGLNSHFTTVLPAAAMVRLPSVQIVVQPAPPENRIHLLGETLNQEFDCERDELAPITVETDCSPAAAPATSPENNNNQDNREDHKADNMEDHKENNTEDCSGVPEEDNTENSKPKRTGKKRKNPIRRFISWWKKTFSCSIDVEE